MCASVYDVSLCGMCGNMCNLCMMSASVCDVWLCGMCAAVCKA